MTDCTVSANWAGVAGAVYLQQCDRVSVSTNILVGTFESGFAVRRR